MKKTFLRKKKLNFKGKLFLVTQSIDSQTKSKCFFFYQVNLTILVKLGKMRGKSEKNSVSSVTQTQFSVDKTNF